ncbi:MAG: Ig-like domain-containing protein [Pseudohongiellaceae bacterium]
MSKKKGKSGNTNGGTEVSFTKTPQARDDLFGSAQSLDYADNVYLLDVMANDRGGKAKWLWSVDDGVNDSGAMSGYEAGDLLTQDDAGVTGLAENISRLGAALSVTQDGQVAYDASSISGQAAADLTGLALGETATDSFIYAIRMSNGTLSWAEASVVLTGVNDAPEVQAVSVAAIEDNGAVTGQFDGDDVDSDDDGSTINYAIAGGPDTGTLTNNGDGSFTYDPGSNFQELAAGDVVTYDLGYTATDQHSATSDEGNLTITVTGVNDDPTLAAGALGATEDGAAVALDLSALGDDVDSDNDGNNLTYSLLNAAAGGSASVSGTSLTYDPGSAFQSLADGQSTSFDLQVRATDAHGAFADNTVTVTVTGQNDAPVITSGDDTGAVTMKPVQPPFTLEQWTGYWSTSLSDLQTHASNNAADYTITTDVIDFTDDPGGFAGEIPGSSPWPAAAATGASGTGGINNYFFARVTTDILITEADTYTFRTFNDDGVFLNVNGQSVIADSGIHAEAAFQGNIFLDPGVYPLELYFFEKDGEASLELSFKNSSGIYQLVGNDPLQSSGTLQFDDVDLSDSHTVTVTPLAGSLGTLTASLDTDTTGTGTGGQVSWQYELDGDGQQQLQSLGAGDTALQQFDVTIDDGNGGSVTRTVDITITGANDAPTANADSATVDEDGSVTIDVLANDTDPDNGDTLTIASAANGQNGTVTVDNNQLIYTPNADYNGTDSFSYTVTDSDGLTSTAAVDVTINPVADPAVLGSAVVNLTETDDPLTTSGTLSISDPDDGEDQFTVQSDTDGEYGSFSIDAGGNWNYTTDGALDFLEDGQVVTDEFTITSVDGTATTVTVNITGTPDGPTAEDDSSSLTASSANDDTDNTVYWVDWTSATVDSQVGGRNPTYTVEGTITLSDTTIGVTYHGQAAEPWGAVPGVQFNDNGSEDYYVTKGSSGTITNTEGVGVFTGPEVGNGPTNNDIIRLHHADSPRTLTFSEPVENLFFAIVSMNNNGYIFDQDFDVVASADSSADSGYYGWTNAWAKTNPETGRYGITTDPATTGVGGATEFHGVLAIDNALESLTWESQTHENWNGFTIGTYGVAQSATVSGNVLDNDDPGNVLPVEVSDVDGNAMVGNSVTLNLASGAILKVDRNGDYLYDDNGAFASLGASDTHVDTVTYTVEDDNGNTDVATLSVTVQGVNDAPLANADSASVDEDSSVTINVLANDTDPDNGDTVTIASAANGQNGTVALSSGQLIYTPNAGFYGTDSFSYTVTDGELTSTAAVEVTVNAVNDAPTISYSGLNIANPSFEQTMTGWEILKLGGSGSGIDHINTGWDAGEGSWSVDLNAFDTGGVKQTITTTPGETYTLGFMLTKNPTSNAGDRSVKVSAGADDETYTVTGTTYNNDMQWTWQTFTFTANSSSTDLVFASQNGGASGTTLDGIVALAARTGEATSITGFDIADPDAGSSTVRIDLSVDHGSLALGSASGLSAVDGDGTDGTLSYTGSLADINAALDSGIDYTGDSGYSGVDTLTALINDQGATGGGALTDSFSVNIQVVGTAPDYVA